MHPTHFDRPFLFTIAALLACTPASASLTLDDFIHEVRVNNHAYQGSVEVREGSIGRVSEADLLTAPVSFHQLPV